MTYDNTALMWIYVSIQKYHSKPEILKKDLEGRPRVTCYFHNYFLIVKFSGKGLSCSRCHIPILKNLT